jgi:hypothetical protein
MTDPLATLTTATGRDARGRFRRGQSGNPAGKKPGTLNHATRLTLLLADDAYDRVARQLIDAATGGHLPSVRFLMERLVPKPRGRAIALDLPPGATRVERLTALVDQMCAGEISADEAKAMIAVLDRVDRAVDEAAADLDPACNELAHRPAEPPARSGLRASLLQTTCISTSPAVMPGLDPGILTGAAAAAARAPVAMAGSSPAMTGGVARRAA